MGGNSLEGSEGEGRPTFSGIFILQSGLSIDFNGTIIYGSTMTF